MDSFWYKVINGKIVLQFLLKMFCHKLKTNKVYCHSNPWHNSRMSPKSNSDLLAKLKLNKYSNSPHLLHLMNVESFRAFLITLMLGMRRSTDCKSMREYLNCLDCAIDAHLRLHLYSCCMESVQVRVAKVVGRSVALFRSRWAKQLAAGALALCGLSTTVKETKIWCLTNFNLMSLNSLGN